MSAPAAGAVEMWEAKAATGAGEELVAWVWRQLARPDGRAAVEVFRSGDRVVVIAGSGGALPEPPPELVARPPHRWRFDRLAPPAEDR